MTKIIWPRSSDLAEVSKLVVEAQIALDGLENYWPVRHDPGVLDEPGALPTFEDLGRLSAFVECIGQDLEIMSADVKAIREALHEAAVRMMDEAAKEVSNAS